MVLEKTLESSLDCKEIKPVNPKGNQLWIFIKRNDAEAEAPIIWQPDIKSQLTGKDPDAGKDWGQEKGVAQDEMVGWHHWLNGHQFEPTPGWIPGLLHCRQNLYPLSHQGSPLVNMGGNPRGSPGPCFQDWYVLVAETGMSTSHGNFEVEHDKWQKHFINEVLWYSAEQGMWKV